MATVMMLAVGLVLGLMARALMLGRDSTGLLAMMAIGVAGAVAAGLVGAEMGWYAYGEGAGIIASVVGAAALLVLHRTFLGARSVRAT